MSSVSCAGSTSALRSSSLPATWYNERRSWDSKRYRVVGVLITDADDGCRLYITDLPNGEFSPKQVATLYRARWVVELLFRELKSQYGLGRFQTENGHIVRIQVTSALPTLVVSRAILRLFVDRAHELGDECVFPTERWAYDRRSSPIESPRRSSCRSATNRTSQHVVSGGETTISLTADST